MLSEYMLTQLEQSLGNLQRSMPAEWRLGFGFTNGTVADLYAEVAALREQFREAAEAGLTALAEVDRLRERLAESDQRGANYAADLVLLRHELAEAQQVREASDEEIIEKQRLLDMAGEHIIVLEQRLATVTPIVEAFDGSVYNIGHLQGAASA